MKNNILQFLKRFSISYHGFVIPNVWKFSALLPIIIFASTAFASYFADWPLVEGNATRRWRSQTNGIANFINPPGRQWEITDGNAQSFSAPVFSIDFDVNNDGIKDIVYINSGTIYAVSGRDDILIWAKPGIFGASFGIGDINADGTLEIAVRFKANAIWLLDARDGSVHCELPAGNNAAGDTHSNVILFDDLDSDGIKEVIDFGYITHMKPDLSGYERTKYNNTGRSVAMKVADFDHDGFKEVLAPGMYVIYSSSAAVIKDSEGNIVRSLALSTDINGVYCRSFVNDMNGDGFEEAVVTYVASGGYVGFILIYDYINSTNLLQYNEKLPLSPTTQTNIYTRCVGDIDMDGKNELIVQRYFYDDALTNDFIVLNDRGEIEEILPADKGVPAWIIDVTGDGVPDLVNYIYSGNDTLVRDGVTKAWTTYSDYRMIRTEYILNGTHPPPNLGILNKGEYGSYQDFDSDGLYELALYDADNGGVYLLREGVLEKINDDGWTVSANSYSYLIKITYVGNGFGYRIVQGRGELRISDATGDRSPYELLSGKYIALANTTTNKPANLLVRSSAIQTSANKYDASNGSYIDSSGALKGDGKITAQNYNTSSQYWQNVDFTAREEVFRTNIENSTSYTYDTYLTKTDIDGTVATSGLLRYYGSRSPYFSCLDWNGDGALDIFITSAGTNDVYWYDPYTDFQNDTNVVFQILDGRTLESIYRKEMNISNFSSYSFGFSNLVDLNNDGTKDIVTHRGARGYHMHGGFALDGATRDLLWLKTSGCDYYGYLPYGLMQFDLNEPKYEIGHNGGCRRWFEPLSNSFRTGLFGTFANPYFHGSFGCIVPVSGNVQRVVCQSYLNYDDVICYTNAAANTTNDAVWTFYAPGALSSIGGDINERPGYEVLVSTVYGELYCIGVDDGTLIWKMEFPSAIRNMIIVNCDDDDANEIVMSFFDGTVSMYDSSSTPDLEIRNTDVLLSEPTPGKGSDYHFIATIYNRGGTNSGAFDVQFYDTFAASGYTEFYSGSTHTQSLVRVNDIPAGGMIVVTSLYDKTVSPMYWQPTVGKSNHTIVTTVDFGNEVSEETEGNNISSNNWYVYGYPDVGIIEITVDPEIPVSGSTNKVFVKIANIETEGSPVYPIARLRYGGGNPPAFTPGTGGIIDEKSMQVNSGGTTVYEFVWVAPNVNSTSLYVSVNCVTNGIGDDQLSPFTSYFIEDQYLNNWTNPTEEKEVGIALDTDGDGIPDWYEDLYPGTLDKNNPADALFDSDGDGLNNLEEFLHLTNPANQDTDGDAVEQFANDFYEVKVSLTDPLNFDTDGGGVGDGLEIYYSWAYISMDPFNSEDDKLLDVPIIVYADLKPSKVTETNESIRVNIEAGIIPGSPQYRISETQVWAYFDMPEGIVTGQLAVAYSVGGVYGSAAAYTGSVTLAGNYDIDSYEVNFVAYCEDWLMYGQAQQFFEVRATNDVYVGITSPNDGDPWRTNVFSIDTSGIEVGVDYLTIYNPLLGYETNLDLTASSIWTDIPLPLTQGKQTVNVIGTNSAGAVDKDWVHIDMNTNPPMLRINSPSDYKFVTSDAISLTGEVGNTVWVNPEGLVYSNAATNIREPIYLAGNWDQTVDLVEGTNLITVTALDIYGNQAKKVIHIIRDTTAPLCPVILEPKTVNPGENITFYTNIFPALDSISGSKEKNSFARNDADQSGMVQVYDSTDWVYNRDMTAEGTYYFSVDAIDTMANTSSQTSLLTIIYDITPPTLTVTQSGRTNGYTSISFNGTSDDSLSGPSKVEVSGDGEGGPFDARSDFWAGVVTNLNEGSNSVTFTLYDNAGNTNSEIRFVFVDTVPPSILITADNSGNNYTTSIANATFSGTATDSESGISDNVIWSNMTANTGGFTPFSAGTWDASTAPVTLQEGINELQATAINNGGLSTTAFQTVWFDPNNPSITITSHNGTNYTSESTPETITGTSTDTAGSWNSGIAQIIVSNITLNAVYPATGNLTDWVADISLSNNAANEILVYSVDGAGNYSLADNQIISLENLIENITFELMIKLSNDYQRIILSWSNELTGVTILAQTNKYYDLDSSWFELATGEISGYVHEAASNYWACYYRLISSSGMSTSQYDVGKMDIETKQGTGSDNIYNWITVPFELFSNTIDYVFQEMMNFSAAADLDILQGQPDEFGGTVKDCYYYNGIWNDFGTGLTHIENGKSYQMIVDATHTTPKTIIFVGKVPTNNTTFTNITKVGNGSDTVYNWVGVPAPTIMTYYNMGFNETMCTNTGGSELETIQGQITMGEAVKDCYWWNGEWNDFGTGLSTNSLAPHGYQFIVNPNHNADIVSTNWALKIKY